MTLGADATLRCHAPPSLGWRAADAATPGGFKPKNSGRWTETLAFKLPVEGVTAEGLAVGARGRARGGERQRPERRRRRTFDPIRRGRALRARESSQKCGAGDASSRDQGRGG